MLLLLYDEPLINVSHPFDDPFVLLLDSTDVTLQGVDSLARFYARQLDSVLLTLVRYGCEGH